MVYLRSHGLDDTYLSLFSALACFIVGVFSPLSISYFPFFSVSYLSVYFLVFSFSLGFPVCVFFITPAASGSGVL